MTILVALGLSILLFVAALLWIFVPLLHGRPSISTNPERIRKALKLANLQPEQVLYDLGAGNGNVLLIGVREFNARAVGIEAGLLQSGWLWLRLTTRGLKDRVHIKWANLYKTNLYEADIVFVYATSQEISKLAPYLGKELKPGARLVSISADFPEWEPAALDERNLIFVYNMPPTKGSMTSYLLKK